MEDRFQCQGCGRVMTVAKDGQDTIDSHKNVHGLVINVGPEPAEPEVKVSYVFQAENQDGDWVGVDQPMASTGPESYAAAQDHREQIAEIFRAAGITRYRRIRAVKVVVTSEITVGSVSV